MHTHSLKGLAPPVYRAAAAVALCVEVGDVNAGTVEFVFDKAGYRIPSY